MKGTPYNGASMNLDDCKIEAWRLDISEIEKNETGLMACTRYRWLDGSKLVATVTIEGFANFWLSCSNLEVFEPYRGKGLSHQIVEFCKAIGVNNLSVSPENHIAIAVYKKHGFYFTGECDGEYLRMRLSAKEVPA